MNLEQARRKFSEGAITFAELERLFWMQAGDNEKDKYIKSPLYDQAKVIMGKSHTDLETF